MGYSVLYLIISLKKRTEANLFFYASVIRLDFHPHEIPRPLDRDALFQVTSLSFQKRYANNIGLLVIP